MSQDPLAAQLIAATELLEKVSANADLLATLNSEDRARLKNAAGNLYAPDSALRRHNRKLRRHTKKTEEVNRQEAVLSQTGIRVLRKKSVFTTPNYLRPASSEVSDRNLESPLVMDEPQNCYVCKKNFNTLHHFYDQLCLECADFNFFKRSENADLKGRIALLTGGRVKIGYQAGIKLLRAGCHLIVTTRFPRDSAARYAEEPDFIEWKHRLDIYGLDLRHTPSVEAFCHHLNSTLPRLDFIINNACQTVRRPPEFYAHMMANEKKALAELPPKVRGILNSYEGLTQAPALSQIALLPGELKDESKNWFPESTLDADLQQVDLREQNSWRLMMAEVSSIELLEVHLVNSIAPYILNAKLKPLMLRTPERDKHIVNVSAVEGQFYRKHKTSRHPHTNMAKAALNMMTRTAATDYFNDGIHMNAVDTGWVTDEDPAALAERKVLEQRFHPPLDIVDGAARIVDPIISGFNTGEHSWGKFLKNYRPTDW